MFLQQAIEPDYAEPALLVRPLDRPSIVLNATDSSRSTAISEFGGLQWARTSAARDQEHPSVRPMAQMASGP